MNEQLPSNEGASAAASVGVGLAQMLRRGVIMDVVDATQARIAETPGRSRSWRSSACRRRSARRAASRARVVCGCTDLGEALRRIGEGAPPEERMAEAKALGAPHAFVAQVGEHGRLPVPSFAAGGIATPADAAPCGALGAEAVFVGSGIFPPGRGQPRPRRRHGRTRAVDAGARAAPLGAGLVTTMIGLLALQGGVEPHLELLDGLGLPARPVRSVGALHVAGLVLPGGESTAQRLLMQHDGLAVALDAFIASGRPPLATCAGLIIAALRGYLGAQVERNAHGSQQHSFEATLDGGHHRMSFIRAPAIRPVGAGVEVLETLHAEPVVIACGRVIGTSCRPELTKDPFLHARAFCGSR